MFLLPGAPFSESPLSECVLELELDVEDESSSSGSSLVSELSSKILYATYNIHIITYIMFYLFIS